jgi:hypothetical protein
MGRIVHYKVSAGDAVPAGNTKAGRVCPAVIVQPWGDANANLMVIPDGIAPFWVTSRMRAEDAESAADGQWFWPARV